MIRIQIPKTLDKTLADIHNESSSAEQTNLEQVAAETKTKGQSRFGPGFLVAAAFIGPGTVISASKAGAQEGNSLLWTILLASLGAIVLQSFAARLGILSGGGLGEHFRHSLRSSPWFYVVAALIIGAIGVGNAAYQTGNLSGAAAGIVSLVGGDITWWVAAIAGCSAIVLSLGPLKRLQVVLIALVGFLSLCFVATACLSLPNFGSIATGLFTPSITAENLTLVVALIGTTIVPYNLFLHASSASQNWHASNSHEAIRQSNLDTALSVGLGGLVTAAIVVTAASAFHGNENGQITTAEISNQLRPVLGDFSGVAFALGLFAAGLTSSITAPLATAYAISGVMGWNPEVSHWKFRTIAYLVVAIGASVAEAFGKSPSQTILFAQVANGLLLPLIAFLVVWTATKKADFRPSSPTLITGWIVVLAVSLLAMWKLFSLFL